MTHAETEQRLLQNLMELAAQRGWRQATLVDAARAGNIPLDLVRKRFPCKSSVLLYLNQLADQAALQQEYQQQPVPEYLFDLFMERFEVLQEYRQGVIAALHALPFNPPAAFMLNLATQNSMKWIAASAGIKVSGLKGLACIKGLTAIWGIALRSWMKDESPDLAQTMATLDKAIKQAGKFAPYFVNHYTDPEAIQPEATQEETQQTEQPIIQMENESNPPPKTE